MLNITLLCLKPTLFQTLALPLSIDEASLIPGKNKRALLHTGTYKFGRSLVLSLKVLKLWITLCRVPSESVDCFRGDFITR